MHSKKSHKKLLEMKKTWDKLFLTWELAKSQEQKDLLKTRLIKLSAKIDNYGR